MPCVGEEASDSGRTSYAFGAIRSRESEVTVEGGTEVVTIDTEDLSASVEETALDEFGDGRLTRAREAGKPKYRWGVARAGATLGSCNLTFAGALFLVGIKDNAAAMNPARFLECKTTGDGALMMQVKGDRVRSPNNDFTDGVARHAIGLNRLERGSVSDFFNPGDHGFNVLR